METNNGRWHIVCSQSGSEHIATARLKQLGFGESYYPMMRALKPVPRRQLSHKQRAAFGGVVMRPKLTPLFPGYLFVRFDMLDGRWRDIFQIIGVRGMAFVNNLPKHVTDDVICAFRKNEVDGAIPGEIPLRLFPFDVGDLVRIKSGPMGMFTGNVDQLPMMRLEELDESLRVWVLINVFGRASRISLKIGDLEKV